MIHRAEGDDASWRRKGSDDGFLKQQDQWEDECTADLIPTRVRVEIFCFEWLIELNDILIHVLEVDDSQGRNK
jgi:hypothetical protein